jgi:hypothetical protein
VKCVKLYSPENVERARYAQIAVAVVAIAVCLFVMVSTVLGVQRVRRTEDALHKAVFQSRTLSRTAEKLRERAASQAFLSRGGVAAFALQLSRWSRDTGVDVESLSPEGAPAAMDITVGETKLGTWNAHKVRINGRGDFVQVMSMLNQFRDPHMPVQLDSVLVQGVDSGISGVVSFNVLCTVYEKKSEPS